jgi:sterol 3beta-glucosyltransferase
MRIAIIAPGSRGDVQPYVALGKGLSEAGHRVRMVTHQNFEALVDGHSLEFWPLEINSQEIVQHDRMREVLEQGGLLTSMAQMGKALKANARHLAERGLAASGDRELLLAGIGGLFVAAAIAEARGIPFLPALNVPFTPTSAFPGALLPAFPVNTQGATNRLSHHLSRQIVWQAYRPADKLVRHQVLGLSASSFWGPFRELDRRPMLYGISATVLPPPADWDRSIRVTGYWFLDQGADWSPPPALEAFLQAGPPPVYIGFGSMSARKPEETANLVVQALRRVGQRAIILSGWSGLRERDLPDALVMTESVPHAWLFRQVAAVVHHGGAGTTAAGLRAGVPTIVIPFHGDQPFWGRRIAELGVGPAPVPRHKLTAESLAQAIAQAVGDQAMRERAARLGATIRAEDGIAGAVAAVEEIVPNR